MGRSGPGEDAAALPRALGPGVFLVLALGCAPDFEFPGEHWETRPPEAVGLHSSALDRFAERVGGDGVVVRQGVLVKSWGRPARRADWASAAKPVLSTLLLLALDEGRIESLDEPVAPWVRRRFPGRSLMLAHHDMTFRHLANMTSGYGLGELPGTHWAYNDLGVKLFSELLAEVFGTSLGEAWNARAAALDFEDGDVFGSRGGAGVRASPRDFARIGWLWLCQGQWSAERLLPRRLFEREVRPQVAASLPRSRRPGVDYLQVGTFGGGANHDIAGQGRYGLFWWFNRPPRAGAPRPLPHLPEDAFYAIGHQGVEVVLVLPDEQMVVAARGNWGGEDLPHARLLVESLERGPDRSSPGPAPDPS